MRGLGSSEQRSSCSGSARQGRDTPGCTGVAGISYEPVQGGLSISVGCDLCQQDQVELILTEGVPDLIPSLLSACCVAEDSGRVQEHLWGMRQIMPPFWYKGQSLPVSIQRHPGGAERAIVSQKIC